MESGRGSEVLWFEFDAKYAHGVVTDRLDGFAVAALLIAMERGEGELIIEGALSERLFHGLRHQLIPILRLVVPELHDVTIKPATLDSTREPAPHGVMTGFSGGVDSFSTIADYFSPGTLPSYRLTHLLFCNVGSNGSGQRVFQERWKLIKDFGPSVGLDMIRVDSNLDELLEISFERTHLLRNASAGLLLQGIIGKYVYSSGYHFRDCYVDESSDISHADPAAVHLLSTERFECISTGCQYSRVEKTRRVITAPEAKRTLNVCVMPGSGTRRNCSRCYKCLRTLATLDLLGEIDGFDQVFDLELYRRFRHRDQYLMMLPAREDDPLIREILELTRQPGVRLPRHVAAMHTIWPALKIPYLAARAVKRLAARLSDD